MFVLNIIASIEERSMDIELEILDVMERYRIEMYNIKMYLRRARQLLKSSRA